MHKSTSGQSRYWLLHALAPADLPPAGHYTAQGRSALDGHWYDFNDSCVTRCDEPSGPSSEAYCLFFRIVGGTGVGASASATGSGACEA
jgi:ubiquitin C-terminal hydrolase